MRWLIVSLCFATAAVSFLDRNNLSIVAASIKTEFHLSDLQLGAVFSSFVLGYGLTQALAGRVADAIGPYRAIAGAVVLWSVFTVLTTLTPSRGAYALALLMMVRFGLGVVEAVIFPGGARLVSSWIPSRERGLASGMIFSGVGIGGAVTPPLVTYLMLAYGWRSAFYVAAVLGLVVVVIWLLIVRDRPDLHPAVTPEERDYIEAGLPEAARVEGPPARWQDVFGNRQVLLLSCSNFCYGYVSYIFYTWFFIYLSTVRGLNLKSSAIYAMLPFIAMTIATTLGGFVSDRLVVRFGKRLGRCGVPFLGMALASVFLGLATQVADARLASVVLTGGVGCLYMAQSAYWALAADVGGRSAGAVSGVINMSAQFGAVVTASLTALIAHQFGWSASFLTASGVVLVGALLWLLVDPHQTLKQTPA